MNASLMKLLLVVLPILSVNACGPGNREAGKDDAGKQEAADIASGAEIGKAAPAFSLKDQDGKLVRISDYVGKVVVLVWINPECPFIQRHYKEGTFKAVTEDYASKGVVLLAVNSTHWHTAASNKQWHEKNALSHPILDDRTGEVGRLYGAKATPHVFIINKDGILAYSGAVDNDPAGNLGNKRIHYLRQALDELSAGRDLIMKESKPYG